MYVRWDSVRMICESFILYCSLYWWTGSLVEKGVGGCCMLEVYRIGNATHSDPTKQYALTR